MMCSGLSNAGIKLQRIAKPGRDLRLQCAGYRVVLSGHLRAIAVVEGRHGSDASSIAGRMGDKSPPGSYEP